MGGRGASANGNRHFKFVGEGNSGADFSKQLLPALANNRIKAKTVEGAMQEFRERYKNADHEWAYVIDQKGYVYRYAEGGKHSVTPGLSRDHRSIERRSREELKDDHSRAELTILHNHPSGSAFSKQDLKVTASNQRIKGVVASGKNYDYVFVKGTQFKGNAFEKMLNNATLTGKDYSDAVDNWLKKNQSKYHYKYYRKKNN